MSDDWDDDEVPAEWSRDVHALSRIADESRAGVPEADLALRLMRDRKLAAAIAEEAPPGDERVALAVGDGPEPPHLIIGRGGGYVATLLGPRMSPYFFARTRLFSDPRQATENRGPRRIRGEGVRRRRGAAPAGC